MHKKTENLLYSAGGLVAAALILVLLNFVLGAVRGRIDLTQGKLYTLSEGTRAVLGKLESPVKIRLYFSQNEVPLPIKAYGRRVEDLLAEFRQAGRGKVMVEKLDPQPDSDAADSASLDAERIDDDVKLLLVIHPRGIGERAQYALDQFVLRGGKLIAFLDPSAYFDRLGQMGGMGGGGTPSSLDKLLKGWGLAFDSGKVVLDMRYLTGAGARSP